MRKTLAIGSIVISSVLLTGCGLLGNPLQEQKIPSTQVEYDESGQRKTFKENGLESEYVQISKMVENFYDVFLSKKYLDSFAKEYEAIDKKYKALGAEEFNKILDAKEGESILKESSAMLEPYLYGTPSSKKTYLATNSSILILSGFNGSQKMEAKVPAKSIVLSEDKKGSVNLKNVIFSIDKKESPNASSQDNLLPVIKVGNDWKIDANKAIEEMKF